MSKLGEFLKLCLDMKMSYEQIMEYAAQLGNGSPEERCKKAEQLIEEIKSKDDSFCAALYENYQNDTDKGNFVNIENASAALGVEL